MTGMWSDRTAIVDRLPPLRARRLPRLRPDAAHSELAPGAKARCARCGHLLASQSADPLDRPLALTLAAAIAFIVANTASLMDLSAVGRFASTTIPYGAYEMWMQGQRITAVIVAFCAVIAPGAYILFMLTVLIAVRRPPAPHWVGELLRWGNSMQPWSMGSDDPWQSWSH